MSSTTAFRDTLYSENAQAAGATAPLNGKASEPSQRDGNAGVGVRLHPAEGSDRGMVANYVNVVPVIGMAFVDFGFIEPMLLHAVDRAAREGQEPPQLVEGRLLTRVALGYDVLAALATQLEQILFSLRATAEKQ